MAALDDEEPVSDRKPPKVVSPVSVLGVDARADKRVEFLIDIGNAVILDVEATSAHIYDKVAPTKTVLEPSLDFAGPELPHLPQAYARRLGPKARPACRQHCVWDGKFLGLAHRCWHYAPHLRVGQEQAQERACSRNDFPFDKDRNASLSAQQANLSLKSSGTESSSFMTDFINSIDHSGHFPCLRTQPRPLRGVAVGPEFRKPIGDREFY
jgi:hypothetical protein